uniref:Uncharacterized protein n=1 Tax=Arundo donax TaxID=35708 RepID=A0A0A9D8T8_ARUDO
MISTASAAMKFLAGDMWYWWLSCSVGLCNSLAMEFSRQVSITPISFDSSDNNPTHGLRVTNYHVLNVTNYNMLKRRCLIVNILYTQFYKIF